MKNNYLIIALSLVALPSVRAESLLNIHGLGMESPVYNSREISMGYSGAAYLQSTGISIPNPSRMGFNTMTSFEAVLEGGLDYIQDDETSNRLSNAKLPYVGLAFQLGFLGHGGLIYYQRFDRNIAFQPFSPEGMEKRSLAFEAGSYEWILSHGKKVADFLSLGYSFHFLLGADRKITSVDFTDPRLQDILGDTTETSRKGWYPTFSATGLFGSFSVAYSTSLPLNFKEKVLNRLDGTQPWSSSDSTRRFPLQNHGSMAWRLRTNQMLTLDAAFALWDKNIGPDINNSFQIGAGYEYQGGGEQYDSYYKKLRYRLGGGWEKSYLAEAQIYRVTGGIGFPLGRRGNSLDVAMELGTRRFESDFINEDFFKIFLSVKGVGIWGRSSRAR